MVHRSISLLYDVGVLQLQSDNEQSNEDEPVVGERQRSDWTSSTHSVPSCGSATVAANSSVSGCRLFVDLYHCFVIFVWS